MRFAKSLICAMGLISLLAVQSTHAAVNWAVNSGSNSNFSYANGTTDNQLFVPAGNSPIVTPTGLLFFPSNFRAESTNGSADLVVDTLRFEIHVQPGKELSSFIVNEFGDYSIAGSGPNTLVKAFGGLFLVNMDTFAQLNDTLDTIPVPLAGVSGVTSGQGAWSGNETVINIPSGWTNIQVILNNELHAGSDPGTSSVIEKKVVTAGVEIILVIPEPATAGMALLAGTLLLARRGRRMMA
jgi:hypothetical protein